jgi:aldose 1-epimerase
MPPLLLESGGWAAAIAPEDGGGLHALRFAGRDILAPVPPGERLGGPWGAFWMIPWANRLDGGRLGPHRLPVNRPQEETAIHGLSRDRPWYLAALAPEAAVLAQDVAAGPYRYAARLGLSLSAEGFALDLTVVNTGAEALPFGLGWHPWFVRPAGTRLAFRASHRCRHDARGLPVAAAFTRGLDGGEEAWLGLDAHFAGWDGAARIAWPGLALEIAASGALAAGLQVYAPAAPAVLCVEPSSHLPDAPNRPDLAELGPMRPLAPGQALSGRIVLHAECSQPAWARA